jgi:hypothetical protein
MNSRLREDTFLMGGAHPNTELYSPTSTPSTASQSELQEHPPTVAVHSSLITYHYRYVPNPHPHSTYHFVGQAAGVERVVHQVEAAAFQQEE